jgi:hypothetical protein
MRPSGDDKRKSSIHGGLADRPADRDNKDTGHSHQGGGLVDEQGIRHEGVQQVSKNQNHSLEKRTIFDKVAAANERPTSH